MITRENWPEDWSKVEPFTPVSDEVYNHFLNVMPPVRNWSTVLQVGEPYDHDSGGALFMSFVKIDGVWNFVGFYHAGEILPVERMKVNAEEEKRLV